MRIHRPTSYHRLFGTLAFLIGNLLLIYLTSTQRVFVETEDSVNDFNYYERKERYIERHHDNVFRKSYIQTNKAFHEGFFNKIPSNFRFQLNTSKEKAFEARNIIVEKKNLLYTEYYYAFDPKYFERTDNAILNETLRYEAGTNPIVILNFKDIRECGLISCGVERERHYHLQIIFLWTLLLFIVLSVVGWNRIFREQGLLPIYGLSAILMVGFVMIFQSSLSIGPDEQMHVPSAVWYENFWSPPLLSSANAYLNNIWGLSYTIGTTGDIAYLMTAKVANLFSYFDSDGGYLLYRLAQVFLCLLVIGLTAFFTTSSMALAHIAAILLVPQFGYVMFYYNGEALSYALSFFALSLIVHHYEKKTLSFYHMFIALFLLVNVKLSVAMIIIAVLTYGFLWFLKLKTSKRIIWMVSGITLLPLLFYRRLINYLDVQETGINRFERAVDILKENINQGVNEGVLQAQHFSVISLERRLSGGTEWDWSLLTSAHWYKISFMSFVGYFGMLNVHVPNLVFYLCGFALILLIFVTTRSPKYLSIIALFLLGTVAASLYYSITHDNQPQGKVLLPISSIYLYFLSPHTDSI